MRNSTGLFAVAFLFASVAILARAETHFVPDPFPTIQSALDVATPGDTVLVGPGLYMDVVEDWEGPAVAFLVDGVDVVSSAGPDVTTIRAGTGVESARTAFRLRHDAGIGCTISGFTFEGVGTYTTGIRFSGERLELSNCRFVDFTAWGVSGPRRLVVENCEFLRCSASSGGAIYTSKILGAEIRNSRFEECVNGAVRLSKDPQDPPPDILVVDCEFVRNVSSTSSGAALGLSGMNSVIRRCLFLENVNTSDVGAVSVMTSGSLLERCMFIRNRGASAGGVKGSSAPMVTVRLCTFFENEGAGQYQPADAKLDYLCLFEHNIVASSRLAPALLVDPNLFRPICNIFWDNELGIGGNLSLTDRIVDPLFCDPANLNLTLRSDSPGLPENSGGCGLSGSNIQGCAAVSVDASLDAASWARIKAKYREPR